MAALQANRKKYKTPKTVQIYRDLEQLLSWEADLLNRLPNAKGFQLLGEEIFRSTRESLALSDLASKTGNHEAKLSLITAVGVHLNIITTHIRSLRTLSKGPNSPRVLTEKQHLHFIEMMNKISFQQFSWSEKYSQRSDSNQESSPND